MLVRRSGEGKVILGDLVNNWVAFDPNNFAADSQSPFRELAGSRNGEQAF